MRRLALSNLFLTRSFFSSVLSAGLVFGLCGGEDSEQSLRAQDAGAKVVRHEHPDGLPVPSGDGWQSLFNGKDLSGWQQKNGWAVYRIDGDSIHGTTSKFSPNSFLCTTKDYSDFELRFTMT